MNNQNALKEVSIQPNHPKYEVATSRLNYLYERPTDIRNPFERDYTRILYSKAYRRLKHKTQVFFDVDNDHVCTRLEHVTLVQSISETIAKYLGLNVDLVKAIAVGHDLGHAPFGHGGEKIINHLHQKYGLGNFFHEKNSLYLIDHIETLKDENHQDSPLNLTYAVRDGIISHCGEVNLPEIKPRDFVIDLNDYQSAGQYAPYTYEGCVVKMADKIAYLSRDIEDAIALNVLSNDVVDELLKEIKKLWPNIHSLDNGTLVHYFIIDVCENSSVERGICLSSSAFELMRKLMTFNYKYIYMIDRLKIFDNYVSLMIQSIFDVLYPLEINELLSNNLKQFPLLNKYYSNWIEDYKGILYNYNNKNDRIKSILDFIAGMTDPFLIRVFNEMISFH